MINSLDRSGGMHEGKEFIWLGDNGDPDWEGKCILHLGEDVYAVIARPKKEEWESEGDDWTWFLVHASHNGQIKPIHANCVAGDCECHPDHSFKTSILGRNIFIRPSVTEDDGN